MKNKLLLSIFFLSLFGIALSVVSLLEKQSVISGSFCTISTTFDCNLVNKGPYSSIYGIPVALLGIVGYGILVIASLLLSRSKDLLLSWFLFASALAGFLFALYLTGIEAFILYTYCLVCLTSQATILAIFILSTIYLRKMLKGG